MRYTFLFIVSFWANSIFGQNTVGVLDYTEDVYPGYTFFSPFSSTDAFIVDNCGQLINRWDRDSNPGLSAYFLDNGLMLRTFKINPAGPFTSASNAGGLELVNWENETVWSYEFNTSEMLSHHDAVMMPNGHILVLTWNLVYTDEIVSLGRDPNEIASQGFMWSEKILEIEPVGNDDIIIHWEWSIKDHYIQDFDDSKSNYGVVAEHPELFDINLPDINSNNSNSSRDWNHFNAIDYNEDLDLILISTRNSDEIWIIDHSTNTAEASSHEGGNYGMGGDILYRWGNPAAYQRANVSDQTLFGQHGIQWIDEGLPEAGKIIMFNNGNGRPGQDFSSVMILDPNIEKPENIQLGLEEIHGPIGPIFEYGQEDDQFFYSAFLSNAQMLPNGNILINAGSPGRIFEITPNKEIAWSYEIPLNGDNVATQGQQVNGNANFRAYKLPLDFKGFDEIDTTPGPTLEFNSNPPECNAVISIIDNLENNKDAVLISQDHHSIQINNLRNTPLLSTFIIDQHGRKTNINLNNYQKYNWNHSSYPSSIYFIQLIWTDGQTQSYPVFVQQ